MSTILIIVAAYYIASTVIILDIHRNRRVELNKFQLGGLLAVGPFVVVGTILSFSVLLIPAAIGEKILRVISDARDRHRRKKLAGS